ncbi:sensor histidine kinase [Bifidobacterium bifidum]|uniref:sensor histidine kinase n=1 Tax=Bifidobacterium bifidum TaxID=1681 RepID=UPI00101E9556|nr:ATP-binding protein [Bifidobacterium bifidum]KAB5613749.1 ATP-binding protein [Bifidobacterium bifidum]KAB5614881.1 ATP-binding protein [Bifidobacterium bifidum]KAB5620042.1 ATP-binding protein [Bifidobacterium bifidum]KAB5623571.1 ATP-binding protein [Bifidobacterium bifidum]
MTCTVQAGENHTIITIDNTTRPPENAADAEDLIQPFHRGDDTRMANRPGHGLGLSIAKACTDAMQATLAVSRPSPGTFRTEIKLPNRPTQRHCPQQKEHGHRPHAGQ